jgi:hypothetical protein
MTRPASRIVPSVFNAIGPVDPLPLARRKTPKELITEIGARSEQQRTELDKLRDQLARLDSQIQALSNPGNP